MPTGLLRTPATHGVFEIVIATVGAASGDVNPDVGVETIGHSFKALPIDMAITKSGIEAGGIFPASVVKRVKSIVTVIHDHASLLVDGRLFEERNTDPGFIRIDSTRRVISRPERHTSLAHCRGGLLDIL